MSTATNSQQTTSTAPELRRHALGFPQLLAQSIAVISPTMTAVLIIPLAFSNVGDGTWAAYLFATVMLLFVTFGLNQFARRSTTSGSMYAYTTAGLGPTGGVLSAWSLVWSYLFIGVAGLAGFAIFSGQFLQALGVGGHVTPFVFFALSGTACWYIAWKDVRLSSMLMLTLEGLSVTCILILAMVVLFGHGFSVDTHQLELKGANLRGMGLAIVVCIFSLVGFEAASTLGDEAKKPMRNVPRAVIWSLILTGAFMVFMGYVEVYGAKHTGNDLGSLTSPLSTLAAAYSVSAFKIPIALGAMVSFFSLTLSCLNAGSRIIFRLGDHGFLPRQVRGIHRHNLTPHIAAASYIVLMFLVAAVQHALSTSPLTIFNDAGTLAAFGFLFAYYMITIAAPLYLRKRGEMMPRHVIVAAVTAILLLVPLVGSFYPTPPWPVKLFPYLFAGYMVLGGLRLAVLARSRPGALAEIALSLQQSCERSVREAQDEAPAPAPRPGFVSAPTPAGATMMAANPRRD